MPAHRRKKERTWYLTHTLCVLIILFQAAIIVLLLTGWTFDRESCQEAPQLNAKVFHATERILP